jgi:L-asparaginase II
LLCASHSGTDEHVATVQSIQSKTGVLESDLMCGVHPPGDERTLELLRQRGEQPTPNRHNCSGKHTGMVAFARLSELPYGDYVNFDHPIQKIILQAVAEMSGLLPEDISLGIDGCSAPNFGMPLYNAALAYARLCDPHDQTPARAEACRVITAAMTAHPEMIGGPGRFDTRLMEVAQGRIVAKGGAEGYQGIGLLPGTLGDGSPGVGIAMKIADGDIRGRARPAVALEVLRLLGALSDSQLQELSDFGPVIPIRNWRRLLVGVARPEFELQCEQQQGN